MNVIALVLNVICSMLYISIGVDVSVVLCFVVLCCVVLCWGSCWC